MEKDSSSRRTFLSAFLKAAGAIGLGGLVYSIFRFTSAGDMSGNPHLEVRERGANADGVTERGDTSAELAADSLPPGSSKTIAIGGTPVIVINDGGTVRAFVAVCTHLGCVVSWEGETKRFLCPCHEGVYNSLGEVVSGPPPSSLLSCEVEATDGTVTVSII